MYAIQRNGLKRVRKDTARKLYNEGVTIYVTPCKSNPRGPFADWFEWSLDNFKAREIDTSDCTFDTLCNQATYYNCNSVVGNYLAFYIREN